MHKYVVDINARRTGERIQTLLIECRADDIAERLRTLEAHYGADCSVLVDFPKVAAPTRAGSYDAKHDCEMSIG